MRSIKYRAYIQEQPSGIHPLEIDVLAGELWDVTGINFKDQIVEIMDDDGNTWEYELNDEIALLQYIGFRDKNGREIYTDYLVKWGLRTYRVCFDCGFYLHDLSGINPDYPITKEFKNASDEFEIVGNVYHNKELLSA
nr:MAG TPA: YopX protein [Caudoviricetes sp.]